MKSSRSLLQSYTYSIVPTPPPLATLFRVLTFRFIRADVLAFGRPHLLLGLAGTWMVGMGRYWDDPAASTLQHLGLGSVIYIFALAVFIFGLIHPLRVPGWTYFRVLTFIALTSFPAVFYAIPVERFVDINTANTINVWFLLLVALWRLSLLFAFFRRFTDLRIGQIITVVLLPMCVIISALFALNLHRVVFNIMGGVRNPGPHDAAYGVLMVLTLLSVVLVIPLLIHYVFIIRNRQPSNGEQREQVNNSK